MSVSLCQWRGGFAQGSDVVEDPERASMGRYDQIILMNPQIAHGSVRQVELQRLPVLAVIEGHPHRILRAREQQALAHGIFADRIDGTEVWQADGYQLPAIASIVGAVDVWMHIIDAEAAHRNVHGLLIEVGG